MYHLHRGRGVPSKVDSRGIIATHPVLFNGKSTQMGGVSGVREQILAMLYFKLVILIKALPRCTLTPITTTKLHILVTKIVPIFEMTSVMTSESRHTWRCWYLFGSNG